MAERRRFLVALLVEGRVAVEIDGLRRALGSKELERIAPHITLSPPKNVSDVEAGVVFDHVKEAGALCGALHLSLGPPKTFRPANGVVFLSVGGDLLDLEVLRAHLARGPLATSEARSSRPFTPHVTLASHLEGQRLHDALGALGSYHCETVIERLSLLEQHFGDTARRWDVVCDVDLGKSVLRGRGGRELTFHVTSHLDPKDASWTKDALEACRRDTYGKDVSLDVEYAITAYHQGSIVGCATGLLRGQICEIGVLIVDKAHRKEGIGVQLLKEVERHALAQGSQRVLLRTVASGTEESFYEAHGYRRIAILPSWREGKDFVLLSRNL